MKTVNPGVVTSLGLNVQFFTTKRDKKNIQKIGKYGPFREINKKKLSLIQT